MSLRAKFLTAGTAFCVFAASGFAMAAPAPKTVSYYLEHPQERKAVVAKCMNDPGRLGKTPDCVNAKAAASRAIINPANKGMMTVRRSSDRPQSVTAPGYAGKTY